jgi:hypothetical protein
MSTTRLVGLLIVHGRARCPSRGIGDHHTTRVRGPLGLWFRPQRGQGGGKGAEEQGSLALLALAGGRAPQRACCLCPGMVLRDVCGLPTRTLSPSVQLTRTTTEQQRQHREQAGREASWLKQVRKVKRVEESKKWVTRPRGEE